MRLNPMTPLTLDDLGLPGVVYVWALLHAHQQRLPVAPTPALAVELMQVLARQDVVELPEAGTAAAGLQLTPLESLAWRWRWPAYGQLHAMQAAEDFLTSLPCDELVRDLGLALWQRLVLDEGQAFYAQQLARCQFDVQWQQDMGFAQRLSGVSLTAAQWRYCGWAAVRYGATLVCQRSLPAAEVRESMYKEVARRACALASGRYGRCALPPHGELPGSALGRGLAHQWFSLGWRYWNELPNTDALRPISLASSRS